MRAALFMVGLLPITAARAECGTDAVAAAGVMRGPATAIYFVKDAAPTCPSEAATCRMRAFVVPGDAVALGAEQGAWRCASFVNSHGTATSGWLPTAAIAASDAPFAPRIADWAGKWFTAYEQEIDISPGKGGGLAVKGDATYGAHDPARVQRGGVNIGELEAQAKPDGDVLGFTMGERTLRYDAGDPTDCRAKLQRVGPYLAVTDNGNCGGHNVSFSGLYRRKG